jgi:hypothetical protein
VPRGLRATALVLAAIALGACGSAGVPGGSPSSAPDASTSTTSTTPSTSMSTSSSSTVPRRPLRRVLMVGDSVALTLGGGFERWGAPHHVAVWDGGALGASMLDGARVRGYWGEVQRAAAPCASHTTWTEVLTKFRPDVVVVLYGAWDIYDASWDGGRTWHIPGDPVWNAHYTAAVTDTARCLAADGAHVVWLAPPCFSSQPITGFTGSSGGDWNDPHRIEVQRALLHDVARRNGMTVTDIVHDAGCPVDYAHRPDGVHFSPTGADTLAARLAPVIERAAA